MNQCYRQLAYGSLTVVLAACNSSSGRDPADGADAAAEVRDASIDGSRDGATMDGSSGGDAGRTDSGAGNDAQTVGDAALTDASQPSVSSDSYVYVGGWGAGDYPVKTYAFDGTTGMLTLLDTSTAFGHQPSFLVANQAGTRLYMTNEDGNAPGITVAALDATGIPSRLDKRADPGGGGLVHAAISPDGKTLLAADYGKGRLVDFPIATDGRLGAAVSTISFGGNANTHSSAFSIDGSYAWVPNKGLDIIGQLAVDKASGQVTRRMDRTTAGDGPRMIAVANDGKYAYVMFENDSSVEAYSISSDGMLRQIDREDTLPDDFEGENTGAHALLHPNGKFLYVSNRGADQIVVFTVEGDGKLTLLDRASSGGQTPRHFAIDAAGRWLIVANQGAGNLVTFSIGADGKLTQRGAPVTGLQQPTAVAIVKKP